MAPIRVLQVMGTLNLGGAEALVMNLYRNLDYDNVQFDFVVHSDKIGMLEDEIQSLGGQIYRCPKFKGNILKYKEWWRNFFKEHTDYRILHSHIRSSATLFIPIAKRFGVKTIIHSHSTANGKGLRSLVKNLLQLPLRFQADYLFACSKGAGEWLFGKKSIKKQNYITFPNAIPIEKFRFNHEIRKKIRQELGIDNYFVIGHVGRFSVPKNHKFLIECFADIHKKNKDTKLLLVGNGELYNEIVTKIYDYDLQKDVIMLGNRLDVANLLQTMDAFIFPSLWEGLPVAVIEAQANGLPCYISENITKDVDLSELVYRLHLDNAAVWTDEILKRRERLDVSQKIIAAGYDIYSNTKKLENFYYEILK